MVNLNKSAFKSVEILQNGEVVRIDEEDFIQFSTEVGEIIEGRVTKISGKGDKTKLQIIPKDEQKEEIWSVVVIADGSIIIKSDLSE